ncbi:MAG: hypothetical protein QM808_11365 [Steroidobacteraceae bacterium]
MKIVSMIMIAAIVGGCVNPPQLRESGEPGSEKMTRCVRGNSIEDVSDLNRQLKQYDGWKLVYVTEHKERFPYLFVPFSSSPKTFVVMCFERPLE